MTHEKMQEIIDSLNNVLNNLVDEEVYETWHSHIKTIKEQILEQFDYECNY